jgi:hypothetical protein
LVGILAGKILAMKRLIVLLLLAGMALPAFAATKTTTTKVTVAQLQQALAAVQGKPDAEVAQQLADMELTEQLSAAGFARLDAALPGDKARQALMILADSAGFLNPPDSEIPVKPAPDPAGTRLMLTGIVNYVNTTARQLPNLIAVRTTTGFEDRPQENIQQETAMVSLSYLPLHLVGKSSVAVTYRDRQEVADEKALKRGPKIGGMVTGGEFGPILTRVVADALQGKITWGGWEQGTGGAEAVFHYAVPQNKSHYNVQFCCVLDGFDSDGTPHMKVFNETAEYHGEIAFDPANGAVLRITLEADMQPGELVSKAGMIVEYGPVEIAGKKYICPVKSISVLQAHTTQNMGAYAMSNLRGPVKTYLNDVVFDQYRRFGSEMRIVPVDSGNPNLLPGPATADSPSSGPSRTPSH